MEECFFEACNFTKSKTPPWIFPQQLYKLYQIAKRITIVKILKSLT